jgi:hypothetical protein
MERKGIRTERGDKNREIEKMNAKIRQNNARIRKLQSWVKEERAQTPPTLADLFSAILTHDPERTQYETIYDLKLVAKALIFVQENDITDIAGMSAALAKMKERNDELKSQSFKISRRLPVLTEHLKHADNYSKYHKVYEHWRDLKEGTPAEEKYYKNHNDDITAWADAHKYFTRVMNGNKMLPLDDWKRELADKTAQQNRILAESQKINAELKNAEAIKRLAERVTGVEVPQRKRTHEVGL